MPRELLTPKFPLALAVRYRHEGTLGAGAMGQVFRAHDLKLDRPVAIKVMRRTGDSVSNERFRREAQALADLDHPGIMKVYDWGDAGDDLFLATELLEGGALSGVEPDDPGDLLRWMFEIASALESVHSNGLLHRDLKPSNVVLAAGSRPVLIDFGLVYYPEQTRLTATSAIVGTLACMAPELLKGGRPTPEADWYAWGASLYILHFQEPPRLLPVLLALSEGRPAPPLKFPGLDLRSSEVACMRAALSLDPAKRPRSREDFERLIRKSSRPTARSPPIPSTAPASAVPKKRRSSLSLRLLLGSFFLVVGAIGLYLARPRLPDTPLPAPENRELVYLNDLDAVLGRLRESEAFDDPANWLAIERKLPEPPVDLHFSDDLLDRARLLDREWLTRRMPRPIGERRGVAPEDVEQDLSAKMKNDLAYLEIPEPFVPETLEVLRGFGRVRLEKDRLEDALRRFRRDGTPPRRMDKSLVSKGRYLELGALVDNGVGTVAGRRGVLAFLAPASLEMRRSIFAIDRALAAEPSAHVRARLVRFTENLFRFAKAFFYGELAYLDPWRRVGQGPKNSAQKVVLAHLCFRVAKSRRIAGIEWRSIVESAAQSLRRVVADAEATLDLRVQASQLLTEMVVDLGDRVALNQDLVAALPALRIEEGDAVASIYLEASVLLEPGDAAVELLRGEWPRYRDDIVNRANGAPRVARLVAALDGEL